MTKRKLTEDELAECAALKAAFNAMNASLPPNLWLSQEEAAAKLGISQGAFSSFLVGRLFINLNIALAIYREFGIPVNAYSTRLHNEATQIAAMVQSSGFETQPQPSLGMASRAVSRMDKAVTELLTATSIDISAAVQRVDIARDGLVMAFKIDTSEAG